MAKKLIIKFKTANNRIWYRVFSQVLATNINFGTSLSQIIDAKSLLVYMLISQIAFKQLLLEDQHCIPVSSISNDRRSLKVPSPYHLYRCAFYFLLLCFFLYIVVLFTFCRGVFFFCSWVLWFVVVFYFLQFWFYFVIVIVTSGPPQLPLKRTLKY